MFKHVIISALTASATLAAQGEVLPPPPTQAHTAPTATPCAPVTLNIYFPNGESTLTPQAQRVLKETEVQLSHCVITDVALRAQTDDARDVEEAQSLGQERLIMVTNTLRQYGLSGNGFAAGVADTSTTTNSPAALNRRIEITLAAYNPAIS